MILLPGSEINFDEFVYVRGVALPRARVDFHEQEVGGKLVSDREAELLLLLDQVCEQVRRQNGGRHTPFRTVEFQDGTRYIHRDLEFPAGMFGIPEIITATGPKKMWFRCPKIFIIGGLNN